MITPPAAADTVTLAQISDVHLGPLPPVPLWLASPKRLAGAANWARQRRFTHLPALAEAWAADLAAAHADHTAVTGDLCNVGLPAEVERGRAYLGRLGPPDRVSVIPGNHDIYGRVMGRRLGISALQPWAPYFAANAAGAEYTDTAAFPFVRILTRGSTSVALIGLNSAVETPPIIATGWLGADQLQRLTRVLDATARDGHVRVVMLHHPPLPGLADAQHALTDASALAAVLQTHGAELVIHGHNHRAMFNQAAGPQGPVPVIGVPSASAGRALGGENLARAHLFQIAGRAASAHITLIARGLASPGGAIVEIERRVLVG